MNFIIHRQIKPFLNQFYTICFLLFSLLSVLCILWYSGSGKKIFLLIPLLFLLCPLVIFHPKSVLFLFIASFYWIYNPLSKGLYFYISSTQILFIIVVIGFLSKFLSSKRKKSTPLYQPHLTLLLLFLIQSFISFFLNIQNHSLDEIRTSFTYVCSFVLIVIAYFVFSSLDIKEYKNKIIAFILFLSVLEIPVVVLQVFNLGGNYLESYRNITGTFGSHHSQLANMMTFPLGFSIAKLMDKPKFKNTLFLIGLAFASLYAIIYSGSRSNLIGIAGAILVIAIFRVKFKPVHFIYLTISIGGLFLLVKLSPLHHFFAGTIHSSETGTLDMSTIGRLLIWKNCLALFWKSGITIKLFGVGMANLMTIPFPEFILDSKFVGGAHNIFLHVLLETGIIGFVLYMTYFISVLVRLMRQSKQDNIALAYFFITLSLLLSGITQEIFWFQPVFGCLWLYHTCLLALILNNNATGNLHTPAINHNFSCTEK
jgi:O-antigen ligase